MRHHHDGQALVAHQAAEDLQQRLGIARVEIAGRLVGQEQWRRVGQRPRYRHPLLLAARQRGRKLVGLIGHAQPLEQAQRAATPLIRGPLAAEVHRQHHVLDGGQGRQQLEELEHDADAAPAPGRQLGLRHLVQRLAGDDDRALAGPVDAGQQVQQGRFAAARLPDDGQEFAPRYLQAQVLQGGERAGSSGVGLADMAQGDQGFGHAFLQWRMGC